MSNYEKALDYLLKNEGNSFVDNPKDSGGPTKFGITLMSYSVYKEHPIEVEDFRNITREEASSFYKETYWDHILGDEINNQTIATILLDASVLYGIGTVVEGTQKVLDMWYTTGFLGPKTLSLLNSTDCNSFVKKFHTFIMSRIYSVISKNPKNKIFEKGWTSRANRYLTLIGEGDPNAA